MWILMGALRSVSGPIFVYSFSFLRRWSIYNFRSWIHEKELASSLGCSVYQTNCPAGIYLLKVNNRNTRTRCEICPKLTIKTPGRRQWCSDQKALQNSLARPSFPGVLLQIMISRTSLTSFSVISPSHCSLCSLFSFVRLIFFK